MRGLVAVLAVVVVSVLLCGPVYAADTPPTLPTVSDTCVGPSPVTPTADAWAMRRLAPRPVWPLTRGAGTLVAVVDTGVSAAAPALAPGLRPGIDVTTNGPTSGDCTGHGTALAGIVAARPRSGTSVVGVAPDATILPVKVTNSQGRITPAALAAGVNAASAAHAGVILVGTGVTVPDPTLRAAVDRAVAGGAVVVAPVNTGSGNAAEAPVWYPAAFPNVIAVGGVNDDGALSQVTTAAAGLDLVAPGGTAYTVAPVGDGAYTVGGPAVAAAFVAGTVALLRAYAPGLSPAQVALRLCRTAQPMPGITGAGAGDVDPYAALTRVAPEEVSSVERDAPPRGLPAVVFPARFDASGRAALLVVMAAAVAAALGSAVIATVRRRRRAASTTR